MLLAAMIIIVHRNLTFISRQQDLESALQESSANWKIVVGHHTIKSIGHHGETKELVQRVLPVLEVVLSVVGTNS